MTFPRPKSAILSLLVLTISLMVKPTNAQVSVTTGLTAAQMVDYITGANVTVTNPVLTCDSLASGTFLVTGSSNIGLDSGIILTTGRAATDTSGVGANGSWSSFANNMLATPGDSLLSAIVLEATNDACRLEFDFMSPYDTALFYYSFASEEYTSYSCSKYNDVFGFFVSGPGITGQQNIALVPGTTIPVAINSINHGQASDMYYCYIMGPGSPFINYYVANSDSTVTYDGFTTVLEAKIPIEHDSTYHMTMVIADVVDWIFDSGVFIRGSSFTAKPANTNSISSTAKGRFVVHPNPFTDRVNIELPENMAGQPVEAVIQNAVGQTIFRYDGKGAGLNAALAAHPVLMKAGSYFLTITDEERVEVIRMQKL